MSDAQNMQACPKGRLDQVLITARRGDQAGLREIELLLLEYPNDPRLHFLQGSLLAARQDYPGAQSAMRHAIELAPDYAAARFQLGLLLLTSGEPVAAQEIWGPLHSLPADHYLRLFVMGLLHMIRDDFGEAVRVLREGIARNAENLPMNGDMEMLIREMERKAAGRDQSAASSVDMLLQQAALKSSKH